MKFLTFVETDLRKIIPFLLGMYVLAFIGFQGLFYKLVSTANSELVKSASASGKTLEEYLKGADKLSLVQLLDSNPYPLLFVIFVGLALILFGFYLWYKEWFGASKRIYTLLSIKGSRLRIFFSKLTVFLLIFCGFYGVVLLNLYLSGLMMNLVLPENSVADNLVQNVLLHSQFISFVIPVSLSSLLFNLTFIVMIFAILSVFVLWDRSKKILGMIGGIIYVIASMAIFFYINTLYLYTTERLQINWAFTLTFLLGSFLFSTYLLKKKLSI